MIQDVSGSWCIKGADEFTLVTDSSAPLMHHDPNTSWITDPDHPKERTLTPWDTAESWECLIKCWGGGEAYSSRGDARWPNGKHTDFGSTVLGSTPCRGHCAAFFHKTARQIFLSVSPHPGV